MIDPPEIPPDQARIQALIECCEKRVVRAGVRLQLAEEENADARGALSAARAILSAWVDANPSSQMELI